MEYSARIQHAMPGPAQRIECLIDSINYTHSTMQATTCHIRASTNNMREDFESSSSSLIEVDPYRLSSNSVGRNANVSSIDFKASSGSSGVDL